MKTYTFVVNATISLATTVEAESLETAISTAKNRGVQGLCHQCSSGDDANEWVLGGELDCDPSGFELVDLHIKGETQAAGEKTFPEAAELFDG